MAQTSPIKKFSTDSDSSEHLEVVEISKYQHADEKNDSAFDQVMSQMNIASRKAFDAQYDNYWHEASESCELLSILICEIDFLQEYKDNYGAQGAAFMLLVVGLALKNTCEKYDCFLARYKNDKFAILIKGGDIDNAQNIAEALRAAIEQSQTEHKFSAVMNVVTLSIGISSIYPSSKKVLLQKSTTALHSAKISGRNQVSGCVELKNEELGLGTTKEELSMINEPELTELQHLMSEMNVPKRNDFNDYFVTAWNESVQNNELLTLVISELDFFEEHVEYYGKQTSDDSLLIAACTLNNQSEALGCFVAHLEGAKFITLIKGGNATKGLKVAEALRESIESLCIDHVNSPVKNRLTMSSGLSNIFPNDENSMKTLMAKSTNALNEAKQAGHDQVIIN